MCGVCLLRMQYESGFKPAKCHRAAASGHKLGFVSLGFLQVRRTGKHAAAFLPYPGLCFPSLTLQLSRARVLLVPFSAVLAWDGCAELSAVLCSSQPPAHQPGQHWESKVPISLAPGCSQCLCHWCGKSCASGSCAPQLVTGTSQCVGPSCPEAFHTSGQGVWGGGCSWKGSAGSCSLPAVICQIISLQPAQMLLVLRVCLGCWKSSRGPHRSAWCPHPGVCSLHSSCPTQHGPSAHSPRRKQQLCRVSCFTATPPGVLGEPQDRGTLPQPC